MLPSPSRGAWSKRRQRVITAYGALAIVGLVLGAAAAPDEAEEGPPTVQDKVRQAIEKVLEESGDGDAGAEPNRVHKVEGFKPSPEPELPDGGVDGGLPESRRLPEPDAAGGQGKSVVIILIEDTIELGLSAFVERAIDDNRDAAALILDIDTPGGRVDAALEIRDALMEAPESMRTVAFIHPRAISAGAFISLACDLIFIADGGSIGAATPIAISGGEAEAVDEKMVSYFRTEMAATARAKGRRGDIAEAMVDKDVEIEGVTPAGKLLTLDTAGALRHDIADAKANSIDDVLELLALGGAERRDEQVNWAEQLARILTHPILSGILMSIGVLGILIELYQPGFGLPGILGISCLVVFFAGHLVVHLAGWEEVVIFLIGVVLLAVEIFATPGFGVVGILGVIAILVSLVFSLSSLPIGVSFDTGVLTMSLFRVLLSILATFVLFVGALVLLPKTRVRNRLVLDTAIDDKASGGVEGAAIQEVLAEGRAGVTESFLRPAGIARFGDHRVDVYTEGDFVGKGERVVIVRTEGNRVIVRKEED
jgi:membrane-bound serine protease (ClpP class)